jgi:hypothetical protein
VKKQNYENGIFQAKSYNGHVRFIVRTVCILHPKFKESMYTKGQVTYYVFASRMSKAIKFVSLLWTSGIFTFDG